MSTDLKSCLVRILRPDGATAGTGFVVTDSGLIVTCAHAVEATGARPGGTVRLVFHAIGTDKTWLAEVVREWWRDPEAQDVAILRLVLDGTPIPEGVVSLQLGSSRGSAGHPFATFGYPSLGPYQEAYADGTIDDLVKHPGG